jgi:hypothetical protein
MSALLQGLSQRSHELDGTRVITVNAKGLHAALADQPLRLANGLRGVLDKRIGSRPWYQRAIGKVTAIGKALGNEGATASGECLQTRTRQAHESKMLLFSKPNKWLSQDVVATSHVVKSAVRLDVTDVHSPVLRRSQEPQNLNFAIEENLLGRKVQLAAAEVLRVHEPWMSPNLHSVFNGQPQCRYNESDIDVAAAGDVGGSDQGHQFGVEGKALAEVAVEVDVHGSITPPSAETP